jgi:signal transduction histidine kinase
MPAFDNAGNLAGRLVVLRDISEDLAQQRFREEISNMLVHDLRAPTSSIQTSLQLIKELIDMGEYEELTQVSVIAYESSEKLINLINSLMEIAKLEQSATMETAAKPLPPIVDQAIETLMAYARTANIRVRNLTPTMLPLLQIDEVSIRRVFINLIDNALRHTPKDGEVRVEAAVTHVRGQAFVQISVTDTGKGIPEAFREQIFEKFSQVPKSALRGQKGTGLGLTYCKRAIEAQGGRIWVEKGPEGGAMFNFTLPVAATEPSPSLGHP